MEIWKTLTQQIQKRIIRIVFGARRLVLQLNAIKYSTFVYKAENTQSVSVMI